MEKLLNDVGLGIAILSVIPIGFCGYYIFAFNESWREHLRSKGVDEFTLFVLYPFAIFWQNLPEQCKVQRRRILAALAVFIGFMAFEAAILFALRLFGFVQQ